MANNTNKFLTVGNIIINFYNIKFMKIVLNKIFSKFFESKNIESTNWAKEMSIGNTKKFLNSIDMNFYFNLKKKEINNIECEIENILTKLPNILRFAAANYELLYFLVRKFRPLNILETGVAIGYSSCFILAGIKKNSIGKLFSSDFHFLGVNNSKKYIGFLPKQLNYDKNWTLLTEGDEFNIPKFLNKIGKDKIDLFHYDSEKSYRGKQNTMKLINNNTNHDTIYIFDDIQDDFFFRDFVKKKKIKFVVLAKGDKFCGVAGNFLNNYF